MKMDPIINKVARFFEAKGREAYLVGGHVRDRSGIKNRDRSGIGFENVPIDLDFAVEKDAVSLAREFADKEKGSFVLLDEPHGTARVVFSNKKGQLQLDFADFRGKDIEEDLRGRDFTINSMAMKLGERRFIIDPLGGLKDIKRKLIRASSERAFLDDPARIMRAFAFKARFGFKIDKKTLELIKKQKVLIRNASIERVRDELFKILDSKNSYAVIKELDELGILSILFPEIDPLRKVYQGPYHHLDVWNHSLETLKQFEKLALELKRKRVSLWGTSLFPYFAQEYVSGRTRLDILKLAALFHDLGKPEVKKEAEGKIMFWGHDLVGSRIAQGISERMKLSTKETSALINMVRNHLRPGYLAEMEEITRHAIFKFSRDCADEAVAVLILSIADRRATLGEPITKKIVAHHEKVSFEITRELFTKKKEYHPPKLLTGNEIMQALDIKEGPRVGEILKKIEEAQVDKLVKTKLDAIEFAKKMHRSR